MVRMICQCVYVLPMGILAAAWWPASAGQPAPSGRPVSIRISGGLRIEAVHPPEPAATEAASFATQSSSVYPEPPLAGFSPLVAITASDKRRDDDDEDYFEHEMEYGYAGNPLDPGISPAEDFIIGILDSGAAVDLVAEPFNAPLGITGDYLGPNEYPIGGAGDDIVWATVSQPIGLFAAGLGAIGTDGLLDLNQMVGHSNDALLVSPEISCGDGEGVSAIIGTSLLSFVNTVIRVDTPRRVTPDGDTYLSPDIQMLDQSELLPDYAHEITMNYGGFSLVATTSAFYALVNPSTFEYEDPVFPTTLVMIPGTISLGGGNFYSTVGVLEGEPGPTNLLQNLRMLVDTGAQSSILTKGAANNLNLDTDHPDFTVDVCGVGGLSTGVPGFYIDYVKINAGGGPLEFNQAPFVVLDLASPDGQEFGGILGMNFFWNRNIVFAPSLLSSGTLHVSAPIPFAYGDFDRDLDVDGEDFAVFQDCTSGPQVPQLRPECRHIDWDEDSDVDQSDFGQFQLCVSGEDTPADPTCGS